MFLQRYAYSEIDASKWVTRSKPPLLSLIKTAKGVQRMCKICEANSPKNIWDNEEY